MSIGELCIIAYCTVLFAGLQIKMIVHIRLQGCTPEEWFTCTSYDWFAAIGKRRNCSHRFAGVKLEGVNNSWMMMVMGDGGGGGDGV